MDARQLLPLIPAPFRGVVEQLLAQLEQQQQRIAAMEHRLSALEQRP